jgi:hypothetical protein
VLSLLQKIKILEANLLDIKDNYADSFKPDILIYFNEFQNIEENKNMFIFLEKLKTKEEIQNSIDSLLSKIVIKYNNEEEQLSDFIFYTLNL